MCGDLWFSLVWSDVSSEIHHEHVNIHTIDSKPHLCDWYQDALNQVTITWNQFSTANLLYYVNSKTWTAVSVFSVHSSCKQNRNRWVKLCLKLWIKLPQQNHSKVVLSCGPKKKTIPQKSSKRSSQQSKKNPKKVNLQKLEKKTTKTAGFLLLFPWRPPSVICFQFPTTLTTSTSARWFGSGGKFGGGHPMESTDPQLSFWEANWWWGLEVPKGQNGAWPIGIFW